MKKNILIGILILTAILLLRNFGATNIFNSGISGISDRMIRKCLRAGPSCYDNEIPKLMNKLSMEDTFRVAAEVQKKDLNYPYCHVLGHKLAAIETKKDPSSWKDVIGRCPSGTCSNGCVHGAFQEKFRTEFMSDTEIESAKSELADICEPREGFNPSDLSRASCYHALGHLFMYITQADINKSVSLCQEMIKSKNSLGVCYDGAFMQIYQPLEAEDFALIKGKEIGKSDVKSFCAPFSGTVKSSCIVESWPLFFDEITTPDGVVRFCNMVPSEDRQDCFKDIFYILPVQFLFNLEYISSFCNEFDMPLSGGCYSMTASRILEIDVNNKKKAVDFCSQAPENEREVCFAELVILSDFVFLKDSGDFNEFCGFFPEKWQEKCKNKE
jgi:hypothetical protein